jgi:nitrogen regulatory protein P-II 1
MKNLVMIFRSNLQQDVADQLRGLDSVSGFTFSNVEGHSGQSEKDPFLSARDKVVGFLPRVRVDILLDESQVKATISAVRSVTSGLGIYWVAPIDEYGKL